MNNQKIERIKRIGLYKILRLLEQAKGIDTVKYVDIDELGLNNSMGYRYEYSKKKYLRRALNTLRIGKDDGIIDLGSGKGSALIEFSRYPFRSIAGVEYSEKLHLICRNNLKKLNITNVDLFCMNAIDFRNYDPYNYIYFYNPFPEEVFQKVLDNIILSVKESKKVVHIIYKNPTCDQVIMKCGCFAKIMEFKNVNKSFPQLDYIYIYKCVIDADRLR